MVKYFFFDCFEVVFGGIVAPWLYEYFPKDKADELARGPLVHLDRGDISWPELIKILSNETKISVQELKDYFDSRIIPHEDMIAFLREFTKEHNVYLLSNASAAHLCEVFSKVPGLTEVFDHIYVSSEMRRVKPNPDFFQYALDDLGVKGEECVMVDDNQKNLDGAAEVGIHTIQYKDFAGFEKEIAKYLN